MSNARNIASGAKFVDTSGDTMTGNLTVNKNSGAILTIETDDTNQATLLFKEGGVSKYNVAHVGSSDTFQVWNYTTNTRALGIDNASRVTMPYQPAFKVGLTGTVNTNPSANTDIIWNESTGTYAFLNGGVTLNTSNGRVTVPVAGKYWVSTKLRSESTVFGYTDLNIKVNGSGMARIYHNQNPGYSQYQEANMVTVIVDLAANDYLSVGLHTGNAAQISATSNTVCWFNGFLIG